LTVWIRSHTFQVVDGQVVAVHAHVGVQVELKMTAATFGVNEAAQEKRKQQGPL
jgi:hypothetical protein